MTNFQKKLLRPRILVPAIVLALAYTGFCLMVGFPWEDVMAKASAKKYVMETYRLTPTRMVTYFLLDYPMRVTVSTKEKEFDFDVYMDRGDLRNVTSDNYLQSMAEHRLRKRLDAYVSAITGGRGRVVISTWGRSAKGVGLTEDEIGTDAVFERLRGEYDLIIILYGDLTENGYKINYEILYDIYQSVFDFKLYPKCINFTYRDIEQTRGADLGVAIPEEDYGKISSPEDLMPYFEKAIQEAKDSKNEKQ